MFIKKNKNWQISENDVTDEKLFLNRRDFLKLGAGSIVALSSVSSLLADEQYKNIKNFTKDSNLENLSLNSYKQATTYNNFYEFSTSKSDPAKMAHTIKTNNWDIEITGLVDKPLKISMDDIMNKFPLQERIYRFRCVEAWSMVVPWVGFSLSHLLKKAKPNSKAKYVQFETRMNPKMFPDQARNVFFSNLPHPYTEGLRLDEAYNDLTFMAVGLYGKTLPKQNGAPIRLVVPWKYGFKSIKSISKIILTDKKPINTWNKLASNEYGFYANVNPKVDHPRWSQAKERLLGKFFKNKTIAYNGYGDEVAHLYKNLDLVKNF
jgi:sulfoxide reductase catalytic subunit YedY